MIAHLPRPLGRGIKIVILKDFSPNQKPLNSELLSDLNKIHYVSLTRKRLDGILFPRSFGQKTLTAPHKLERDKLTEFNIKKTNKIIHIKLLPNQERLNGLEIILRNFPICKESINLLKKGTASKGIHKGIYFLIIKWENAS